ncbi:MAG: hydantoinase/oxoprolinase family protein, partial [Acidobacteria bacterium]|nr:hydantoinase/oxoprolinase family protein [Acidobacteriota bacterium]
MPAIILVFMLRIGVDTGGTFTDFVWVEKGRRRTLKVPSTPDDPARAVREGLARLAGLKVAREVRLPPGSAVVHGSTVATNALLEGKVARVALITNTGFEDILAIGRQNRPDLYHAAVFPPEPLVPARRRLGIPGRLGPDGEEWAPLDAAAVTEVVRQATASGINRFAVCLLHAYANPAHEEEVGRLIEKEGAEATLSSRILPEYREYERTSTTVVNAVLAPVMSGYLERLEASLPATRLSVFRSNGGILSARAAGREAVQTLLSGPAAGVLGAWTWGRHCGLKSLITFDMGGTSTDVSLV